MPTAVVLALLTVPFGLALAIDGRTIGGELIWVKPMKFAVALTIYLGTLAWFAVMVVQRRSAPRSRDSTVCSVRLGAVRATGARGISSGGSGPDSRSVD